MMWLHVAGMNTKQQTDPPSIPIAELFPKGIFPEGERQSYSNEYVSPSFQLCDKRCYVSCGASSEPIWVDVAGTCFAYQLDG